RVDGDDELRVADARRVLDLAADARGDVDLGLHFLAGEPDPVLVGEPAQVRREGTRAAHLAAHRGGEVEGELQVVLRLEAAARADDDRGRFEVHARVLARLLAGDLDLALPDLTGELRDLALRASIGGERLEEARGERRDGDVRLRDLGG